MTRLSHVTSPQTHGYAPRADCLPPPFPPRARAEAAWRRWRFLVPKSVASTGRRRRRRLFVVDVAAVRARAQAWARDVNHRHGFITPRWQHRAQTYMDTKNISPSCRRKTPTHMTTEKVVSEDMGSKSWQC